MGEVYNTSAPYVADYQKYVTALFNYPMFFNLHSVFGQVNSMYEIRVLYDQE